MKGSVAVAVDRVYEVPVPFERPLHFGRPTRRSKENEVFCFLERLHGRLKLSWYLRAAW
jgi:hypothetical protein